MLKNHLKVALRQMLRHKGYTAINALGLSVGFACCLVIFLFVYEEVTFDRFHEKSDRIFRLVTHEQRPGRTEVGSGMSMPVAPALEEEVASVRNAIRIMNGGGTVRTEGNSFSQNMLFVDAGFFDTFTFPLVAGSTETALENLDSVVLTREAAMRFFGAVDVTGRLLPIRLGDQFEDFVVTGVAEPPPSGSSIRFEMVLRFERHPIYEGNKDNPDSFNHEAFIELEEGADMATAAQHVEQSVKKTLSGLVSYLNTRAGLDPEEGDAVRLELQPITEVHLDSRITTGRASNPLISLVMGLVAFMVLASGCINFVNLSIGRAATRMREVGIRKVVGAARAQLMRQFWAESVLVCTLALILGLVMAEFVLPWFNGFIRRDLALDLVDNGPLWLAMAALLGLTTFVAGGYPALYMTRVQPATVLKGNVSAGGKGRLRSALIVVQFAFAVLFVASMLTMTRQLQFLQNADPGFEEEQVVTIPLSGGDDFVRAYKERVLTIPGVVHATTASNSLGQSPDGFRSRSVNTFSTSGDREIAAHLLRIDPDYLRTLGLELVWGRMLTDTDRNAVLINETLASRLESHPEEVSELVGFSLAEGDAEIAGIVRDFNFEALRSPIEPILMYTAPVTPLMKMFVRVHPEGAAETLAALETHWNELAPDRPFSSSFLDEDVDRQYTQETRQIQIAGGAMTLAVLIACFGLLGLAVLAAARRTKEIGVRKALGASVPGLVMLLSREFLVLVGIAFVLAAPLAWFLMDLWLSQFAFRTNMGASSFVWSGVLVLTVAWLTVGWQAVRAARMDPVQSLRYE